MKSTGFLRIIDDLGKVVIPKEIRRHLEIQAGDTLDIFYTREGEIVLKKYYPELSEKDVIIDKLLEYIIINLRHCPIQDEEYKCKYGFRNAGCKECYLDYIKQKN